MNKADFISVVASKTGVTKKDTELIIDAYHEALKEVLAKGDKVQFVGFGTYDVADYAKREGHNPRTGETITIAAYKAPRFRSGKQFKDAVNVPTKKAPKGKK